MVSEMLSRLDITMEAYHFYLVSLPASFNLWLASPEARFLRNRFVWCNWDVDELKAQAKEIEEGRKLSIGMVGWPFGNVYMRP